MSIPYVRAYEHESDILKGNCLNDPHERRVVVYLPPNYSKRRKEPYPVLFMLAGWGSRGARYLNDAGAFAPSLPDVLDEFMTAGQMPEAIVIFPDCTTRFGASQYVNSTVNGNYMDYVCDELVDWVDHRFHTHKSRDYRGVIGHSSGGFGALVIGMMRADRFGAICSSAGDSWYEFLYIHTLPATLKVLRSASGVEPFLRAFGSHPDPLQQMSHDEVITMMNLSVCTCFSPNPHVPVLMGDLYFDIETGELVPDIWRRFLDWDPVHMVDRYTAELRSLRWIHLEAGIEDEYGLQLGHRQIKRKLDAYGIQCILNEYPGRHGGHHHRMPHRMNRMLRAMLATA